jgi:hypothetical protein
MNQSAAIIIAGGLIAAAIALTNHWQIAGTGSAAVAFARLDRWTGAVVWCGFTEKNTTPMKLDCSP